MSKRFPLLKVLLTFMLSFVGQLSFADGILVFQVTDTRNKPLEGVTIKLSGDKDIADLEFKTDVLGRYTNPKFKSGTYDYQVMYGDWAKGTITVPEEEFGWANINFRELSISFKDNESKPIEGRSATLYVDNNGEKGAEVGTKFSDKDGLVKFVIPEGNYIYQTLKGEVKVTVDDKVKTQEVSIPSGKITHKTYFEFQKDSMPYRVTTKDILIYMPLSEDKDSLIGRVAIKPIEYARTTKAYSAASGKFKFEVETYEFGKVHGTFNVTDNASLDSLIIPINLNSYIKGNGGDAGTGDDDDDNDQEDPFEKELAVWKDIPAIGKGPRVKINVFDPEDPTKPLENVFCYMDMVSLDKPMPYALTDKDGHCDLPAYSDEDYKLHIANKVIDIEDLKKDTIINIVLEKEEYTELSFRIAFEGEEFNPTSVEKVVFLTTYETDSFYMPAELVLLPTKKEKNDTLYYDNPLRVGAGSFTYNFNFDEKGASGDIYGHTQIYKGDLKRYAYYNITPYYRVKVVICKPDTISRYLNAFPIKVMGESTYTSTDGVYSFSTHKDSVYIKAVDEEKNVLIDKDTTIYFFYDKVVQNVYFKFVHDGEVVYPNFQYLEVFVDDSSDVKKSAGILLAKDAHSDDKVYTTYPDSINLENGDYYVRYTMKDFFYQGTFDWKFNIENARGTDTTIYVVIPAKRNVQLIITDALGEYVESVIGKIYKYDESGEKLINTFKYDNSQHDTLLSNENGVIVDHLLPGKYQLRILDIVKNFVVGDYDLKFDIRDGVPLRHVKFIVKNKNTQKPMQGLELVVNKDSAQYSTDVTSATGEVVIECVNGDYDYVLNYGKDHKDNFTVKNDTTIYIYVEDEVKIESLVLDAKDCLAEGASVQIEPIISPVNATRSSLKWTMTNPVLGYIDATGKFTANTIGLTGFVTIKATTTDGTDISAEKMIQIGGTSCGDSIKTEFEDGSDEIARTDDSLRIVVKPGKKDPFKRCYAVQELQANKWVVIAGPTQDTSIVISTVNMNEKEHTIRVISGTDCDKIGNGDVSSDDPESADKIGDTLKIKNTSIFFKPGINGICEKMDDVLIEIEGDNLDNLVAGTNIKWYSQTNGETEFVEIPGSTDKTSINLDLAGETTIKVALVKETTELIKAQKKFVSEDSLKIKLTTDKERACYGDAVNLKAVTVSGVYSSLVWEDSSNVANRNITADTTMYKVVAESKLGYCPNVSDSIMLVVDFKPEVDMTISRDAVCDDSSNVKLAIISAKEREDLIYSWNGFETTDTVLTDVPMENTTYEATVSTSLGICESVTLSKSVAVAKNVEFAAHVSDSIYCKNDEVAIAIEKINGGSLNENIQFTLNNRIFAGDTVKTEANTTIYAIRATDLTGGCPDAVDTIKIKIDQPVEFTLTQTATTICNIGSDSVKINVVADPAMNYSYAWSTGAIDTTMITVYPEVDSSYAVTANSEYERCKSMTLTADITVNEAIKVSIESDADRICQTGADSVKLTATAENGEPTSWIWWDGAVTSVPERTILPTTTSTMWVRGNDNVCAVSDTASVTITVDAPHTAHLATTSTKFVYGGTIDMVASFDGKVEGPITWYSEDGEGNINILGETEELKNSDMPSGDVQYYFIAKNGACNDIKSDIMTVALVDEIEIPTVFTPFEQNGENDEFMLGYEVVIYDRFGNLIHRGDNGWDGTYKGDVADAGVYVYTLILKDGREKKGTIQVFKRD